jgi:hypothetical protein
MTRRGWQSVARIAAVIGWLLVAAELLSGANAATGVPPATVSLATFAANWGGHDRGLVIRPTGIGFEQVNSGCCPPSFKMTFRIYRPRHTPRGAGATLRVIAVYAPRADTPCAVLFLTSDRQPRSPCVTASSSSR